MTRDTRPSKGTGELRNTNPTTGGRDSEPVKHDTQPIEKRDLLEIQKDTLVEEILKRKLREMIVDQSEVPLNEDQIHRAITDYDPTQKEMLRKRILVEDRATLDLLAEMYFENQSLIQKADHHPLTLLAKGPRAEKVFESNKNSRDFLSPERVMVMVRFDLDGFKKINDQLGHAAGDETLKRVASELKKAFFKVRRTDLAIHFSGDEFGLLLSGVKPKKRADGTKQTLEETIEEIVGRYIAAIEKITLPNGETLTASAGFKIITKDNVGSSDFAGFSHEADSAAILAKRCKNIGHLKNGSLRITNADEPEAEFLERKDITPSELAESSMRGALERTLAEMFPGGVPDAQKPHIEALVRASLEARGL